MSDLNELEKKIHFDMEKDFSRYRKTLQYLEADLPITALCLPKAIENALLRGGYERVYDLFGHDLAKIKGLGRKRLSLLAARLDEFLPMSF